MSEYLNFSLEGKVALVTGASYGIGYAIASAYAKSGAKIVFCDIKQEFVDKGMAAYTADGIDAKGYVCDVTNEEMVQEMVKKIEAEVGVIDILVNNAGISLIKQINDTTAEEYDKIMSVNARSYFLCSREAIKLMLKNHEGAIVNVSSMWGQTGASCEIAYSMSKAAVIGLTRSLAEELAPSGITVNCVCPGIIDTRMNNMFDKNELEEEVPLGRLGTSEEVADAIFYLTQNKYITAQILGVNGGII